MGLFSKLKVWFKYRGDNLAKFLIKNTDLTGGEAFFPSVKSLVKNYASFASGLGGVEGDGREHFSVDRIKTVYEAFNTIRSADDLRALSSKLKDLNGFYPNLYSLLNDVLMPVYSQHVKLEGEAEELNARYQELSYEMNRLISDYAAHRKEFSDFKSDIIKLVGNWTELCNDFKLFIKTLGEGAERLEDLYLEGLAEEEVRVLLDFTSSMGLVARANSFYELTSYGEEFIPLCSDCETIDYAELLDDNIGAWGVYLGCLENADNPQNKQNDPLVAFKDSMSLLNRVCPSDRRFQKRVERHWNVIKRSMELGYDGGDHVSNYVKSIAAVKEILKIMNKVKQEFL